VDNAAPPHGAFAPKALLGAASRGCGRPAEDARGWRDNRRRL